MRPYDRGFLAGIVAGFCGTVIGQIVAGSTGKIATREIPLMEKRDFVSTDIVSVPMTPKTIVIRVLSREKFERQSDDVTLPGTRSLAFSTPWRDPCTIYLPEGWRLRGMPSTGEARFASSRNADTLAHEILHCERGSWHGEWKDIFKGKISEKENEK